MTDQELQQCAQIEYQLHCELAALVEAGLNGTIIVHVGRNDIFVEAHRKLQPVPLHREHGALIRKT